MASDLKGIIEELKLERDVLRDGGYGRSVRTPWKGTRLLRDSVTCLNFGEEEKAFPCHDCTLWEWVPVDHRKEEIPCHFIPLNDKGESIHTLEESDDRDHAEELLMAWLDLTIQRLEEQVAKGAQAQA